MTIKVTALFGSFVDPRLADPSNKTAARQKWGCSRQVLRAFKAELANKERTWPRPTKPYRPSPADIRRRGPCSGLSPLARQPVNDTRPQTPYRTSTSDEASVTRETVSNLALQRLVCQHPLRDYTAGSAANNHDETLATPPRVSGNARPMPEPSAAYWSNPPSTLIS